MDINAKVAEEEAKLTEPKAPEAEPAKDTKPEVVPAEPAKPEPIAAPKELDESVYAAFEADIPGSSAGLKRIVEQEKKARDEARVKAEEADRILKESQARAKEIEERSKKTEASELKRMAQRLVKDGDWTQQQADAYLQAKGVSTIPDIEEIAQIVAATTENAIRKMKQEEENLRITTEQAEIRSKIKTAVHAILAADPTKDVDDAVYLLKKANKKNPNLTIEQATEEVVKQLKPEPKKPDTKEELPPDEKLIEEEKKSIFGFLKPK